MVPPEGPQEGYSGYKTNGHHSATCVHSHDHIDYVSDNGLQPSRQMGDCLGVANNKPGLYIEWKEIVYLTESFSSAKANGIYHVQCLSPKLHNPVDASDAIAMRVVDLAQC